MLQLHLKSTVMCQFTMQLLQWCGNHQRVSVVIVTTICYVQLVTVRHMDKSSIITSLHKRFLYKRNLANVGMAQLMHECTSWQSTQTRCAMLTVICPPQHGHMHIIQQPSLHKHCCRFSAAGTIYASSEIVVIQFPTQPNWNTSKYYWNKQG